METKRLISAVAFGLGLILLYYQLLHWYDSRHPQNNPPVAASQPATTTPATNPSSQPAQLADGGTSALPATGPTLAAAPTAVRVIPATQPFVNPARVSIGLPNEKDAQFAMQVNLAALGGGIHWNHGVILNSFKMTPGGKDPYRFETVPEQRRDMQALASRTITVGTATYDLAGLQWSLVAEAPDRAIYAADVVEGDRTLLQIKKSFQVFLRSYPNLGYEIQADTTFVNRTDQPLTIKTELNGTVLPPAETNRSPDRVVVAGFRNGGDSVDVEQHAIEDFKPDKDGGTFDLTKSKDRPAVWVGTASTYFGAVVLPLPMQINGVAAATVNYIAEIKAHGVNLDDPDTDNHNAFLTFQTTDIKLDPGKPVMLPLSVFLGPKWRDVLDKQYYVTYPRQYNLLLIIRGNWCGFCTFPWLVEALVWLLKGLHWVFRDWGLAIIGLVAIVRVILHPITRRSQISMSKMSKMGPEMKRLQEKYKDDKEALNKAMIEFHKEQGLGPYLGCLPMFLQTPIWIALYGVLQSTFELRHAPFLWNLTWIHDLSQPDYLVKFAHPVHVWFFEIRGFNLVPVLLAIVMAIQQQFMPKPVAATPEQVQQQRMMQWLSPIMFLVFFYNLPSGLNLYIFTSTAVGIVESKIVRDHIKAREEAEKAGRVFVETKPTRGSKGKPLSTKDVPSKGGAAAWLGARWAKLLEQAEQARQEQGRRGNK